MEMHHAQVPMGEMGDAWDVANVTLSWLVTRRNISLGTHRGRGHDSKYWK